MGNHLHKNKAGLESTFGIGFAFGIPEAGTTMSQGVLKTKKILILTRKGCWEETTER